MAVVKSVFKDSGSFGQTISAKASTIYGNAVSQLSELSTKNSYTSNGLYSYSSGLYIQPVHIINILKGNNQTWHY